MVYVCIAPSCGQNKKISKHPLAAEDWNIQITLKLINRVKRSPKILIDFQTEHVHLSLEVTYS